MDTLGNGFKITCQQLFHDTDCLTVLFVGFTLLAPAGALVHMVIQADPTLTDVTGKMLAAIAASAVLFSAMTAAASAAAYKKGDVDMDGKITAADAQLALIDYTEYLVAGNNHALSKEQLALADVCRTTTAKESGKPFWRGNTSPSRYEG